MSTITRRRFLQGAAAGGAVLWGGSLVGLFKGVGLRAQQARYTTPLPLLPELTDADIDLHAQLADVQILDGAPTRMWTFNGVFPGPTIRRPSGTRTTVTVHHDLPADIGTLTLHHHGGHQASEHDGQPEDLVIEPGASRTYVYDLTDDGDGERAATEWYHDHSHRRTGRNTWMGLLGLFIVDDGLDAELGLPTGDHDIPLVIADRAFDGQNQLVDPFTAPDHDSQSATDSLGAGFPPNDEVVGNVFLVNGAPQPYTNVDARRYRFRILNASNFRVFNLALSTGQPMVQVANESGLLPKPVTRTSILLGPAERAEVVVDFAGREGQHVDLLSVPVAETAPVAVPRTAPTPAEFMRFAVGAAQATDATAVPPALRALPAWAASLSHTPDRIFVFDLGVDTDGKTAWTINGQTFDHTRVDARPELGSTETWMFVNAGPVAISHYIHIHDVDWYVLSRNLAAPDPWEAGLKETFRLDPGEVVLVGSKFTDHLGRFMIHCHMLEHEDHGMMTTFEVSQPGAGDAPTAHLRSDDPVRALVRAKLPVEEAGRALAVLNHVSATGKAAPLSALGGPLPRVTTPIYCKTDTSHLRIRS